MLPGFRPRCFPRGLIEGLLPLEAAGALSRINQQQEHSPTKGLYSQIQCILATDIQDFILTPLLTCHVTLGATAVREKPPFLEQRSPAQKHSIRMCLEVSQSLRAIPGQFINPPLCHHQSLARRRFHRTPTTSHATRHQQLPIIRRSRRQNSCTPIPINN